MNPDFSSRPFVAGSLFGLRAFDVDAFGRLTGVSFRRIPWTPGENKAICMKGLRSDMWVLPSQQHDAGTLECDCGFYGYFDGTNDYLGPEYIAGLIEGYGVTTVGDRGFRAQKAKIHALIARKKYVGRGARSQERVASIYGLPLMSRSEALEAFPLTEPEVVLPETTEDFWTRDTLLDPEYVKEAAARMKAGQDAQATWYQKALAMSPAMMTYHVAPGPPPVTP